MCIGLNEQKLFSWYLFSLKLWSLTKYVPWKNKDIFLQKKINLMNIHNSLFWIERVRKLVAGVTEKNNNRRKKESGNDTET